MQLTELETALINRLRQMNDQHPAFAVSAIDSAYDYDADRKAWAAHYTDIVRIFSGVTYCENAQVDSEYYRKLSIDVIENFATTLRDVAAAINSNMKLGSLDTIAAWLLNQVAPKPTQAPPPPPMVEFEFQRLYGELFGLRVNYPCAENMRNEIREYVKALKETASAHPRPSISLNFLYRDVFGKDAPASMPNDEIYREIWKEVQTWKSLKAFDVLASICDFVYSLDVRYFADDTNQPYKPTTFADCKQSLNTMFEAIRAQVENIVFKNIGAVPVTSAGMPLTITQLLSVLDDHLSKPQAVDPVCQDIRNDIVNIENQFFTHNTEQSAPMPHSNKHAVERVIAMFMGISTQVDNLMKDYAVPMPPRPVGERNTLIDKLVGIDRFLEQNDPRPVAKRK